MSNFTLTDVNFPFMEKNRGILISLYELQTIEDVYMMALLLVSIVGIVTNGLNIKTFVSLGIQDGVTVSLFTLSLSDWGFSISCSMLALAFIFTRVEVLFNVTFPMHPWVVNMFVTNIGYAFYAMSNLTTTLLAVARCMCVAKPLNFKNVFSRSRSIVIHVCFGVVSLCGYIPVLSQMGTRWTYDVRANTTRYVAWMSDKREEFKDVVFLIFDTILTFSSQVVLIFCVVVMANCLRHSGKFRQLTKVPGTTASRDKDEKPQGTQSFKLSGKELQVVQQVTLISTICILCALPKIFSATYSLMEPQFDISKDFHNLYFAVGHLRKIFEVCNSASTFLIYYKYNSRFRAVCFGVGSTCQ